MSRIYPLADGVIANSTVAANDLIQNYRICADKLHVIHNPLDIELIRALADEPIDDRWFNQTSSPMVLAVGSLTVLKDFPTLLRAFSIVRSKRDCRLVILGQGPERELLDRIAAEQGLKADFYLPGFVQNPFAWMRGAAVLVSSSLTEGCPNALMQALACGTAVVSTDCVGGSSEILEGGRWGWLVPVMDAQAMAASIEAALDCKSPTNVRQRAEDFQIAHIARLYLRRMLPGVDWPAAEH